MQASLLCLWYSGVSGTLACVSACYIIALILSLFTAMLYSSKELMWATNLYSLFPCYDVSTWRQEIETVLLKNCNTFSYTVRFPFSDEGWNILQVSLWLTFFLLSSLLLSFSLRWRTACPPLSLQTGSKLAGRLCHSLQRCSRIQ